MDVLLYCCVTEPNITWKMNGINFPFLSQPHTWNSQANCGLVYSEVFVGI